MQKTNVVFVHGAWHGKWCWDKYFRPAFENQGYNVITFDLPGHDKPGKIKGINSFSLSDYVLSLTDLVSNFEEPPIIIGHSMGGLVVQKFLEKNTCSKVVLLASVPPYGAINATLKFATKGYFYPSLLGLNLFGLVNTEAKTKHAFFSDSLVESELSDYTQQMCSESFLAFLNMLLPRVRIPSDYQIPTLVVGANQDRIFSANDNRLTASKFNAELIMIDNLAHDVMLDTNHEKASSAILSWLEK